MRIQVAAKRTGDLRAGFAMIVVLLALLALLVLCAPFLWTAGKVDEAAARVEASALARHGLDSAAREARHALAQSHPAIDTTPDFDGLDELQATRSALGNLDPMNDRGAMWQFRAADVAARIDLGSATPHVIANALGAATFLLAPLEPEAESIPVADARGFEPAGYLWIDGEIVRYGKRDDRAFRELTRGVLSTPDTDCGPASARGHGLGTPVIAQEAWALPMWRARVGFDAADGAGVPSVRALAEAGTLSLAGAFTPAQVARLERMGTFWGGVGAVGPWQRAVRLLEDVSAGADCVLRLSETRFVTVGSTVLLRQGTRSERALVARVTGAAGVVLIDPVQQNYTGGEAELLVLAARPVNINTAAPEVLVALFENISLAGRNERVTASEAAKLATRIVEGRPFTGFGDLLERIVLPAAGLPVRAPDADRPGARPRSAPAVGVAGTAFLSIDDAQALWRLFENANDAELRFATAPITFVSGDVFDLELRAAQNAPSGIQRAFAERVQTERVAPGGRLLRVWGRQVDFEEELRIDRDAPGWATGPEATSVFDTRFGASPPPRRPAQFPLPLEREDEPLAVERPILPSAEPRAWVRPWPSRVDEEGPRRGRVLHFDRERSHPEGRLLSDQAVRLDAADGRVAWVDDLGLARPLNLSFWMLPSALPEGAYLFDVGGNNRESDRVSLLIEGGDLVLRVLDGVGDHPASAFEERAEVRYALAAGEGPGLPLDTWSHVEIDVRGTRPDQIAMRVDGLATARTPGLTRLASALGDGANTIAVESTEGFPDECVLRIGAELIEAVRTSATSFSAQFTTNGPRAGFGGRLAREVFLFQPAGAISGGLVKSASYDAGTPVALYGYSIPLATNAPPGGGAIQADLGAFAVARVVGVEGGSHPSGKEIYIQFPSGPSAALGRGFEGALDGISGLRIGPADPGQSPSDTSAAFAPGGGYAAILQQKLRFTLQSTGETAQEPVTIDGTRLFEVEVVRYSGRTGDVLSIAQWGLDASNLPGLAVDTDVLGPLGGSRAFVVDWGGNVSDPGSLQNNLEQRVLIVPISLPIGGADGAFLPAAAGASQFAQITETEAAELTEWVRYDTIATGQLVRDDALAIEALWLAATGGIGIPVSSGEQPGGPGGGGPGGGGPGSGGPGSGGPGKGGPGKGGPVTGGGGALGGGGSTLLLGPPAAPDPSTFAPPGSGPVAPTMSIAATLAAAPVSAALAGPYWQPDAGLPTDDLYPLTRAARTAFQFRGVLGTHSHPHSAGTPVLPVFALADSAALDPSAGWPGRLDHAFLVDASPSDPGWPVVVHRAYRPQNLLIHTWMATGGPLTSSAGGSVSQPETRFDTERIYVALIEPLSVPIASNATPGAFDARTTSRLVLPPSGERPRTITAVAIGGEFDGAGVPPAVVVDEVVFGGADFGASFGYGQGAEGASFVLAVPTGANELDLVVRPNGIRLPQGVVPTSSAALAPLPPDAGLLRVGEELIAYAGYDEVSGTVTVAPGGRGLLASLNQPHGVSEPVHFLSHVTVGELSGGVGAEDAALTLEDLVDFPYEGTVLIGRELVHYTARRAGALTMPRRSVEPGARDSKGSGLFRGRFGTVASGHGPGAPVVLFPFRYWDRFAPRADVPELHYFGLALREPDAFVLRVWFEKEEPAFGGATLRVLQRTDSAVPWDAEPGSVAGLVLLSDATARSGGRTIAVQTSRAQWRVFSEYNQGAFDPEAGMSHGWKEAPQLPSLGVEFVAPGRILRAQAR